MAEVAELERMPGGENVFDPEHYILLVGFGGQLEPKINREYMANGYPVQRVEVEHSDEVDLSSYDLTKCRGVVLSGGNDSVYEENARCVPEALMELKVPKLGICYGQQALAHQLGGTVERGSSGEFGATLIELGSSPLFNGIGTTAIKAMMNRADIVTEVPEGFRVIAKSPVGIAGMTDDDYFYSVQFHPESNLTDEGTRILLNFATEVCGMAPEPGFTEETYRQRVYEQEASKMRLKLGSPNTQVVVFDSGGVDSATAHAFTQTILERPVQGIYVDTGMMRHEDGDTARTMNGMGYPVDMQDWSQFFLHEPVPLPEKVAKEMGMTHLPPMDQTTDPQIMRKIVKYGFIEVNKRIGAALREGISEEQIIALVQGTNLADKIESGDFKGDQIKEHHNSGVEEYVDMLIEPLSSLFKGDIRKMCVALGLPPEIAFRQPFPGPGLCLRVGANKTGETIWPEKIDSMRRDIERIAKRVGGGALSAAWLPMKATGQMGDVKIINYMTVLSGSYDPELIEKLAYDIPAELGASRVLWTPSEVDPDAIRSVPQMVNEASLEPLKDLEEAKRQFLKILLLNTELTQHYVASLPINLSGGDNSSAMTRMFLSGGRNGIEDLITGEAAHGGLNVDEKGFHDTLGHIRTKALALGYSDSLYDATHKPPGTVELS